ncbi:hypothetical protein PIB30_082744 [Stylosanthes scabra]|uniref:Ubiquitin-like protease family profile domain-containing protein n=1 Tax=Stylosanthes scabra TaxID=79078 RepID=A0ABU6UST7_9FABA|nr:hypothetical protein [Stylosanthes scabra]
MVYPFNQGDNSIPLRYTLSNKYKPAEVALDFFGAYMSRKVRQLIRVFIPIFEDSHWYLVIVDFPSHNLIILDSLPCIQKNQQCKRNAIKVATYLEAMLDGDIFHNDNSSKVIDCSGFWPITPFGLPTQKDRSLVTPQE